MPDQQLRDALRVTEPLDAAPVPRLRRGSCRASLKVENVGPERAIVRQVDVTDVDGMRGEPGSAFAVRVPALLRPRSERRIPIRFDVPRTSPPGTYRFEVDVAGLKETMAVQVPVRHDLGLNPATIFITETGTSIHHLVASNRGNVPLSVDGVIAVPLDDELIVCRSLRGAIAIFDDETVDPDAVTIDQLVARAAHTAHDALHDAIIRVRFTASGPLDPGSTVDVEVKITTPEGLDPRTRYVAIIPVLTATLEVIVLPRQVGGIIAGPTEPTRPTSSAGARAATSTSSGARTAAEKAPAAKRSTAKKTAAKKTAAKKAPAKKAPAKRSTTTTAAGTATKAGAKKAAARKRTGRPTPT